MFIKDLFFCVEFSSCAERYYCRDFYRKYKDRKWLETRKTIIQTLERAYGVQMTSLVDTLKYSQEDEEGIFKLDFKVAGTNESPKGSGNRAVFHLINGTGNITILLVYCKDHCPKGQKETQWIFEHIKANFPECRKFF